MGRNGMQFVFSVIVADVNFCSESIFENKSVIYIGNKNSPILANNNCPCTITPVTLQGQISVNLLTSDAANIRFVLQNEADIVMKHGTSRGIPVTGVVQVIYQTGESDRIAPVCLELKTATDGTFSVKCEPKRNANVTNTTNPRGHATTQTTDLLGPTLGGICAVIVIAIAVIVIVVVVRRRKRYCPTPAPKDEDITTENPIYDSANNKTLVQNDDTNNDAVHYHTLDDVYAERYTRNETNQHANYSKVDKTSIRCKDNTSRNTPHNHERIDNYDHTDVKRKIQPFNEYNHLSTVHRYSQDPLGDYDRTTIHLAQINEGHDGDAGTYNTAFSH